MKLISPSVEVLSPIDGKAILQHLELAGKVCWKSESGIKDDSCEIFLKTIIDKAHESVLEHYSLTVRFVCSRGCSHQLVRHRIAAYSQESTRYCNYSKGKFGGEIVFIKPIEHDTWDIAKQFQYGVALEDAERSYLKLTELGMRPEDARGVLPTDLKTEVVATMNMRSWRHFFKMRTDKHAQKEIRYLANELLSVFKEQIPIIFDDLGD